MPLEIRSASAADPAPEAIDSEPLADKVDVAAKRLCISLTQLYDELKYERLVGRKVGRRTLIERTEQLRWLKALPVKQFSPREARP